MDFGPQNFVVQRGNRQGCPLSPTFAVANEALAEAIRRDPFITGLNVGKKNRIKSPYTQIMFYYLC